MRQSQNGSCWIAPSQIIPRFSLILKKPYICQEARFLVLTCIVTTSFEGKKLDYKCTHIHHPPSDLGAVDLGVVFLFVWRPLFHQSPSSCPSGVLPALISLYNPPKGLSWSLHFFPGTLPTTTTLCTHQWPKCVQWFHRRHQKWCMHRKCAHGDTCTRFCTLGLNLSMT